MQNSCVKPKRLVNLHHVIRLARVWEKALRTYGRTDRHTDGPTHPLMTWCKLTRRLGFTHKFCIKSPLIFKISSSEGKYFQLLCLYMRNQPFFRFAPHFWCRNQGRKIRNLGKNGLFDGQFLHKSKREITVSSQNRFFCILKKISFFLNVFRKNWFSWIFDFLDLYAKRLFPVRTTDEQNAKKGVFWAIWLHEMSS